MKRASGTLSWVLLVAFLAAGCAQSETSGSGSFVEWVSERAIAIDSPGSGFSAQGLAAFRESIGSARVVGIGESRHDTREQLLLKGALVRHLVGDLGFRVLILEESFPHAEALDRYVATGEGDLREIMNALAGWYLWDTEEMLDVVQWIRQFNSDREPAAQVRIFGMDVTAPAQGVRIVLDVLRAAGIENAPDARALGLDLQEGDFWPRTLERYGALSDERRQDLSRNYARLLEIVNAERPKLVASSSKEAFERVLTLSRIGSAGNGLFSAAGREEGGEIRERGMSRTVLEILDRSPKGVRAIVWAHNLHVAKSPFRMPGFAEGELTPLGVYLSEALGEDYLAIGAAFGKGAYTADLPPGERTFALPSEETLDGALAKVGNPCLLADLRDVERGSAAERWLGQEREWVAQEAAALLAPATALDLVYFVSEISRSQPTPRALQRFRSPGG